VLGIDRFDPPHAQGSATASRITRLAIGEGAHSPSPGAATRFGARWSAKPARRYDAIRRSDYLEWIGDRSHHVEGFFDNTIAAAKQHGIAHEILDAAEIRGAFRPLPCATTKSVILSREPGFCVPKPASEPTLDLARKLGAAIHINERALRFDHAPDGVSVTTERGPIAPAS
jgi:hypothetical protein